VREPWVSVILPVFNGEGFVGEAIESVWAQRYEHVEVIVVDDGSTDGSAALVAARCREHPRLRLLQLGENRGPAAARNRGLAEARSELITFLDADDLMTPHRLLFQVGYLADHDEFDVVVGTEVLRVTPGIEPPAWVRLPRAPGPRHFQMSMMLRREILDRVGPFDESFRISSDSEWAYRAETAGVRTARVGRPLLIRRIHGANLTYRTGDMRRAMGRGLLKAARMRLARRNGAG
jgi:glycosyltransferase involved in cell wall biosynthesis